MKRVKVMLVDDSPVFAEAAVSFLAGERRLDILAAASSGHEALGRLDAEQPDLVLMDLHMPAMDGIEATRRIKLRAGAPRVIMISLDDTVEHRSAAKAAGADAFLGKSRIGTELIDLIDQFARPEVEK
jgi:CheY-like chemotaxis protein